MNLGQVDRAVTEANTRGPFAFAPPPAAIQLAQAGKFADRRTNRNGFDMRDLAEDGEVHSPIVANQTCCIKGPQQSVRAWP